MYLKNKKKTNLISQEAGCPWVLNPRAANKCMPVTILASSNQANRVKEISCTVYYIRFQVSEMQRLVVFAEPLLLSHLICDQLAILALQYPVIQKCEVCFV